jgi:glycosyltransferase involved in cell wall biosynthesis
MISAPTVTVALPIYNSAHHLEQTLRCILDQSLRDFEVIAVLDGCTDKSEAILEQLKDERFQVIRKPVNEGHVRGLMDIHRAARGEFVARFDSDDLDEPERLAKQIEFMRAHPDVDVVGTQFDYIDGAGNLLRESRRFPLTHERIKRDMQRYSAIGGPTCFYRRERILALGGYSGEYNHIEDLALWLTCLAAGYTLANLPDVLVHYRVYDAQASQRNREKQLPQLRAAYDHFGPLIWGKQARPYGAREPRVERWRRKLADLLER